MKSVDPGILSKSSCFSFQPADFAKKHLPYLTWCGHYYCTEKYYMERDTYPYNLILFVRQGKMDVRYEKSSFQIGKGDVLLMDCNRPHYYHAQNGLEFLYLHFDGGNSHDITRLLIQNNGGPVFQKAKNMEIGKELYDCVQFYEAGNSNNMLQEMYWLNRIFYQLSMLEASGFQEIKPVDTAIQYIQEHIGASISLNSLADMAGLSPYYFAHIFKKNTGYAPAEYVLKTRLQKAMLLLTHSQHTVNEIAYEVGYGSSSAFINIFTKKTGLSPKTYRNMERSKS